MVGVKWEFSRAAYQSYKLFETLPIFFIKPIYLGAVYINYRYYLNIINNSNGPELNAYTHLVIRNNGHNNLTPTT